MGVALFFILSGAVLQMSNNQNFSIKNFFKKRFLKICIPQWIGFLGAMLLTLAVGRKINCDFIGGIISFFGLNYTNLFWNEFNIKVIWIIGEWFTAVIIFLYLIFPLLRWAFNHHRIIASIMIVLIFAINLETKFLTYKNGWFSITNGLMCFWIGMLFEKYKYLLNKNIISVSVLIALVMYIINPKDIMGYSYLTCFIFSISLFISLYHIKFSNRITKYFCKYCYEIYLTHHRIYIIFLPALLNAKSINNLQIFLAFLVLTGITFLVSEQLQKASIFVIKKIQR